MHAQVMKVWAVLSGREGWEKLPKYALGVSSGASMVSPYRLVAVSPLWHGRHKLIADSQKLLDNKWPFLYNIM